jgi:membrane-bound lytic murein transglycosylase B
VEKKAVHIKRSFGFLCKSCLVFCIFFQTVVSAASGKGVAAAASDEFSDWLKDFQQEVLVAGISRQTVDEALNGLSPIAKVVALDRNQPEFKLTLDTYLSRFVSAARIENGKQLLQDNRVLLEKIHHQYGVQPCFLVALWGIETNFGQITGDFPIIPALVTLVYDGRRRDFFKRECLAALRLVDDGVLQLTQMKGSWAGAMGELQFLPSVFARYAVDFNRNGRIDVWQERGDIFASGANYLRASGWRKDQAWGVEIALPSGINKELLGLSNPQEVKAWQDLGIRQLDGRPLPHVLAPAAIIQPDGAAGRSFLVFPNYQVLLIWNRSHYYAIGVGMLADSLLPGGKGGN